MSKLALMQYGISNINDFLNFALANQFDMIVVPLKSSELPLELNFTYPDLILQPKEWSSNVVTILSNNLTCDSDNPTVRTHFEEAMRSEFSWAQHLQGNGTKMLSLNGIGNFNLARIVLEDLAGPLLVEVPVSSPYSLHALNRLDIKRPIGKILKDNQDPWKWWNEFRCATNYSSNIKVVLTFDKNNIPSKEIERRWLGEPVEAVIIPISLFLCQGTNQPVLPKMWLNILKKFLRINANIILSIGEQTNLCYYAKFFRNVLSEAKGSQPYLGFENILALPQQPLKDDLPCEIYEEYEKDKVKYKFYQDAIGAALKDRIPDEDKEYVLTVIMIIGAGRGPLVRSALNASAITGRQIRIYVIEKNINAIRALTHIKNKLWINKDIQIIFNDIRDFSPPEKIDIIVSELLGSFGDNELSPECLDCAQKFLKPDGISIPCKYTSYINPIMSWSLYNQIRQLELYKMGPYQCGSLYSETAYVVMFQNIYNIGFPKALFTFQHPTCGNDPIANQRYKILKFEVDMDCTLNGLAGYFDAVLYGDIKLSINPQTHTRGLISWFGIFFPITNPMPLKRGDIVEIHFWRCASKIKIWYEWQIASPQITHVHNRGGQSYPICLQ